MGTSLIINPDNLAVPIRNANPFGKDSIVYQRAGALAAGTDETILTTTRQVVVDRLEWSTSAPGHTAQIAMRHRLDGGSLESIQSVSSNGAVSVNMTVANISEHAIDLWAVRRYDTQYNLYKFALAKPLFFPRGCFIFLRNNSSTDPINIAASLFARAV